MWKYILKRRLIRKCDSRCAALHVTFHPKFPIAAGTTSILPPLTALNVYCTAPRQAFFVSSSCAPLTVGSCYQRGCCWLVAVTGFTALEHKR